MKEIVMLDQRIIALVQEVQAHPKLATRMKLAQEEGDKAHSTIFTGQAGDADIPVIRNFEQGIGFLAAEVGILVHGNYTYEDICELSNKIREKLVEARTVVVNSSNASPIILLH